MHVYRDLYLKYYPFRCQAELFILPDKRERIMIARLVRMYSERKERENYKSTYKAFHQGFVSKKDVSIDSATAVHLAERILKNDVMSFDDDELVYVNNAVYRYRYRFGSILLRAIHYIDNLLKR